MSYTNDYVKNNISNSYYINPNYGLIIGDSRGKTGISPAVLMEEFHSLDIYNISENGGNSLIMLKNILNNKPFPKIIFAVVSPASIFGFLDSNYYGECKKEVINISLAFSTGLITNAPFTALETKIKNILKRNIRFNLGFEEFKNLLFLKDISEYTDSKGWSAIKKYGNSLEYSKIVNEYAYRYKIIENYKNQKLIELIKQDFVNKIIDSRNEKIDLILIRVPVTRNIKNIEDEKYPWFDEYITEIACKYNIKYINNYDFKFNEDYSDGSHLDKNDAVRFTKLLNDSLKNKGN